MQKYLLVLLAMMYSATAWGHEPGQRDSCAKVHFAPPAEMTRSVAAGFAVLDTLCYADASGSYVLQLLGDEGKLGHGHASHNAVKIDVYQLTGGALRLQAEARDAVQPDESGVAFLTGLIELGDIDGDGLIDPIVVYRFYPSGDGSDGSDDFAGRIKLITFHQGQKVAIRAVTGELDESRSTSASPNYFKLPKQAQDHLVNKMKRMYEDRVFGFDNSSGFKPRRER